MKKTEENRFVTFAADTASQESQAAVRSNRVLGWWFVDRAKELSVSRDVSYRVEFCYPQHRHL